MSYATYLRNKLDSQPKVLALRKPEDASQNTHKKRLEATQFFFADGQGVGSLVRDTTRSDGTPLLSHPAVSSRKATTRPADASTYTAYRGHIGVGDDAKFRNGGKITVEGCCPTTTSVYLDTWTLNNSISDQNSGTTVRTIFYANGYWVAGDSNGSIWYTTDPTGSWTENNISGDGIYTLSYGNGYWVAGDTSGRIWYTTDPTGSWSQNTISSGYEIDSLLYANGYWVAGDSNGSIWYTTDPTGSWGSTSISSFGIYSLSYGNGYWVAGTGDGTIWYTTDPTGSWTSNSVTSDPILSVFYGNGTFVLGTSTYEVWYTTNPTGSWSSNLTVNAAVTSIFYANGYWILVDGSGSIWYTTDPTGSWTENHISNDGIYTVFYANGYWVAGDNIGNIWYDKIPVTKSTPYKTAGDITRERLANCSINKIDDSPKFVDNTIRLSAMHPEMVNGGCCDNSITEANHTHSPGLPICNQQQNFAVTQHTFMAAPPEFQNQGVGGARIGAYYNPRSGYVENKHGNDLNVNPRRVPTRWTFSPGAPAHLKINDPKFGNVKP